MGKHLEPQVLNDECELAWLAGYLEGEGSFHLMPDGGIAVTLQTTDSDVVSRVAEMVNGKFYATTKRQAHHKQAYALRITGKRAGYCMARIHGLMGVRRSAKISECVEHFRQKGDRIKSAANRRALVSDLELEQIWISRSEGSSLASLARKVGLHRETMRWRLNRLGYFTGRGTSSVRKGKVQGFHTPQVETKSGFNNDLEVLSWLAGLLEGEGSFTLSGGKVRVTLKMTDEDVVRRYATYTGSSVIPGKARKAHWKPDFTAHLSGTRAVLLMRAIRPLMGQRRQERIAECIDAFDKHRQLLSQKQDARLLSATANQGIARRWVSRVRGDSLRMVAKELDMNHETLRKRLISWGVYDAPPVSQAATT